MRGRWEAWLLQKLPATHFLCALRMSSASLPGWHGLEAVQYACLLPFWWGKRLYPSRVQKLHSKENLLVGFREELA